MKIKICKNAERFLSADEYKYLILLEFYEDFISDIEQIKKKVANKEEKVFRNDILLILQKHHIPLQFLDCVVELILKEEISWVEQPVTILDVRKQFNRRWLYDGRIIPPNKLMKENDWNKWFEDTKKVIKNKLNRNPALPLIQINKRLSRNQLKKHIDLVWKDIEKAMMYYEKLLPFPIELSHVSRKNLAVRMSIYRYRKENGLSSKEIYKKIQSEYRVDYAEADREIDMIYSDFRKLLIKLHFIKVKM